jgi:hypothetical protein
MRRVFEPAMEKCVALYGASWDYHTNCTFRLDQNDASGQFPTGDVFTPDGAISDGGARLALAVEVANSQQLQEARNKIQTMFDDSSVIAGIILNLDETPAYASPKDPKPWDSNQKFVTYEEWPRLEHGTWGPVHFRNHCWGGAFTCHMEVYWPGKVEDVTVTAVSCRKA